MLRTVCVLIGRIVNVKIILNSYIEYNRSFVSKLVANNTFVVAGLIMIAIGVYCIFWLLCLREFFIVFIIGCAIKPAVGERICYLCFHVE